MRCGKGRMRPAHAACGLVTALLTLAATPAAAGTTVVRDIVIEEFAPVYPDARQRALNRAVRQAAATALAPPGAAHPASVSLLRAQALVSFIEVIDETVRPEYYAIRVSVGLAGNDIHTPDAPVDTSLPVAHTLTGTRHGMVAGQPAGLRLGIKVPHGTAGALGAYRALLAGLDVQSVTIHQNPDVLLDVTVGLRRRPLAIPEPSPDSGIVVTDEPSDGHGPAD